MAALDSQRWHRASPHLDHVLDLGPGEREAALAVLRSEDPLLADDVGTLLDEHCILSAEGFLDDGARPLPPPAALAGLTLGAYTLVESIGHGGMGSVWLAARSDGRFDGKAAVKLLNAELVGRAGGARFKREGTILARLTHPNIARLIDAGVSSTGQPYLVLEHIDGRHIDRYCDDQALGLDARIRLFLDVLSAVAQAHANLIVHRDLKPSNVLVTRDGQVKLLDFGIAKLLEDDSQPGEPTLTRDGAGLTPKYAAPEQVSGGPITTATDVYALGVLLYELLSGHHPIGKGELPPAEIVKALVDSEPGRVSSIVANPGDTPENLLAAKRATTPDRLRRALKGDLDTIVAKAMKKDARERYASVIEFADDLRRFLAHQPISARPDTFRYRATKFCRRHFRIVAAAAAAVIIVSGLVGFYTVQLANERDRAALQAGKASRISELLMGLLTGADPYRTPDAQEPTVRSLLDRGAERVAADLAGQPELQAEMFNVIGRTYDRMGLHAKAQPLLERALALGRSVAGPEHARVAQSLNDLGTLHRTLGNVVQAQALLEESVAMRRRVLGNRHQDVAVTLVELGRVLKDRGRNAEAEALFRESLEIRRHVYGEQHRETTTTKSDLALLMSEQGDLDGAESLFRECIATFTTVLGPDHPNAATTKGYLASVLTAKGDPVAAEALVREGLASQRKNIGVRHPSYALNLHYLAVSLFEQGRLDEAQSLLEEALLIARPLLSDQNPRLTMYAVNLARVQIARNEPARAEPALRQALATRERLYPPTDWRIGEVRSLLAAALAAQARLAEAERLLGPR